MCSSEDYGDAASCSKRRVTEEDQVKDDLKKSRVEDDNKTESTQETEQQASSSEQIKFEAEEETTKEHSEETEFNIGELKNILFPISNVTHSLSKMLTLRLFIYSLLFPGSSVLVMSIVQTVPLDLAFDFYI